MIGPIQARLTLAEEERAVLISRQPGSQPKITPEFFTVLEKVACIKADCQVIIIRMFLLVIIMCQVLLSAGHQAAALSTMDQMSDLQEAALDRSVSISPLVITPSRVIRLYRWAQATVRNTELSESALAGLGQAMGHLQNREMLFQVNHIYFYNLAVLNGTGVIRANQWQCDCNECEASRQFH